MKKRIITFILLAVALMACPDKPRPTVSDASTQDLEFCQAAEQNLINLSCIAPDGTYTARGKKFSVFCRETMLAGVALHPSCIAKMTSCSQLNSCVQTGQ